MIKFLNILKIFYRSASSDLSRINDSIDDNMFLIAVDPYTGIPIYSAAEPSDEALKEPTGMPIDDKPQESPDNS
tara:strand:+ start:91 stop:312 length:222 start_codon:yes stop_codon:yes gene_type:complete